MLVDATTIVFRRLEEAVALSLSYDEYLSLFLDDDKKYVLMEASKLVVRSPGVSSMFHVPRQLVHNISALSDVAMSRLTLSVFVKSPPSVSYLVPNGTIRHDAPSELVSRVVNWASKSVELGISINRIRALLWYLDRECDNGAQIRFLWPSILALCAFYEGTKELGDRLRVLKPPRSLPSLPQEVKLNCRLTAQTIAAAQLMPEPEVQNISDHTLVKFDVADTDATVSSPYLGAMRVFRCK